MQDATFLRRRASALAMKNVPLINMPPSRNDAAPASDAPLRVLILTDHVGGGTGQHILSLLTAFDPARASVVVLSAGRIHADSPTAQLVRRIPPLSHLDRFPFAQVHTVRALIEELRRTPVDVLHTYGFWPLLYGRLLKRLGVVHHLIENREDDGHLWSATSYRMLRFGKHVPDRILCVSRSVATHVAANERRDGKIIEVIENGATRSEVRYTSEDARRLLGLPPGAFVVGTVASNIDRPIKGIRYLVEAMPTILERVPDAWFLVVGDRSPDSSVEEEMELRHVMHRVVLTGYRDDVADLYPAMDVLVMPSLSEGLPIAPLEAMR
ncbi:MAG: glycosyltransferase family 4 protein, partial [Gemmatimonadaceae bacterium]